MAERPYHDGRWQVEPARYGTIAWMKKAFNINDRLFRDAKAACGAATATETMRLGMQALVRHAAYLRLRDLLGTEPDAQDVPRRRKKTAGSVSKRKSRS